MLKRHHVFVFLVVSVLVFFLGGCHGEKKGALGLSNDLPSTIGIGTQPTGGHTYVVGTGLAKVISDLSPMRVIVQPYAGSIAFIPLIETGELLLALQTGNDVGWAYMGEAGYAKPYKNVRVLLRGHDIPTIPLIVREDSGIKKIADLRGKRVAGEYGSNFSVLALVTAGLESGGLTWDDVNIVPVPDPNSAIRALQEGRVDAAFGGTPTGASNIEVNAATSLHVLNFGDLPPEQADNPPAELVEILQKHQPSAYIFLQEPSGIVKEDVTIISYPFWLIASSKLSVDAAYEITKLIYENDEEIQLQGGFLEQWKKETMFDPAPHAPFHEGAVRFWKEKGLWNAEAEENQKKLLER
ncbi:MAG: TAXI family TRAP transporter solute-binding subunit [Firmicutes bacterium]|nr:TAXI family TRAP transporter solute-binding subunit [Bacillota bacterium]